MQALSSFGDATKAVLHGKLKGKQHRREPGSKEGTCFVGKSSANRVHADTLPMRS